MERFTAWVVSPRLAWVALGLAAALAILTASLAWNWVGKRFPGFLVTPDWIISQPLPATWSGAEAGLVPGMKIVKVDGEPVDETPSQFIARLRTDPAAFLHRIEARPSGIPPRERVATSVHLVESREFPSGDFAVAFMFLLFTFPLIGAAFMSLLIEPGKLFKDRPELHLPTTWFGLALSVIGLAMTLENLAVDVPGLYQAAMGGAFLAGWGVTRAFLFRKSMAEWRLADKIAFAAIALFTAMAMTPDLAAAWAGGT